MTYLNYMCSTHRKTDTCQNNNISNIELEKIVLLAIRQQILVLLTGGSTESTLRKFQAYKQHLLKTAIGELLHAVRVNKEYLTRVSEDFATDLISESEDRIFRKGFNASINNAESHISALRDELGRLENEDYARKLMKRFLEHKNIVKLERVVVVKLIKSIVVSGKEDIKINFRYLDGFQG